MAVRAANLQRKIKAPLGRLTKAARSVLSSLGLDDAELGVLVVGDRKMRSLNREYRGMDRTTDVLSFSMLEGEGGAGGFKGGGGGVPLVLGDVVISAPRAAAQAEALGHGLEREMVFLLVHGILHLAGYDHERSKADERRMRKKQRELIKLLGPV